MEQYEILQHTGDVKIRVFGETKKELFLNAAAAFFEVLQPKRNEKPSTVRRIQLNSSDLNSLLVDFLSELNYLRQVNQEVYTDIKVKEFSDRKLEADIRGYEAEKFGEDIKAVTFHDLDIHQNREGFWETIILFDV